MPDDIDPNAPAAPPAQPPAQPAPAAAPAPPAAAPAAAAARRPMASDLDDETLAARLERERKKGQEEATQKLLKQLGVSSLDEAKAAKDAAAKAATEADAKRKAEMSEIDRLKVDLQAANERAERLATEKEALEQERQAEQAEQTFVRAATKHVDPSMVDAAKLLLANEIRRRAKEDPGEEFTERDAERFFRRLVANNPRFAMQAPQDPAAAAAAAAAAKAAAPVRKVLNVGAPPTRTPGGAPPKPTPETPGTRSDGRTLLPGQPNSLSRREAVEAAKREGYNI